MSGPITVLVRHMQASGASKAAVLLAVADMERSLAASRVLSGETVETETVSKMRPFAENRPQNETVSHQPTRPLAVFRKAISGHHRLSRSTARVGAAILDQYNTNTGVCMIGTARLAEVSGVSRASVFRAIKALQAAGLFACNAGGGMGNCNVYRPLIDLAVVQQNETVSVSNGRRTETQSQRDIYNNLPAERGVRARRSAKRKPLEGQRELLPPMVVASGGASVERQALPLVVPPNLIRPYFSDMPRRKAAERLWNAWAKAFPHGPERARHSAAGMNAEAWRAGVEAEYRVRGQGLDALRKAIDAELLTWRATGAGPP